MDCECECECEHEQIYGVLGSDRCRNIACSGTQRMLADEKLSECFILGNTSVYSNLVGSRTVVDSLWRGGLEEGREVNKERNKEGATRRRLLLE